MFAKLSHKVLILVTVPVMVLLILLFTLLTINREMQVERELELQALGFQSSFNSVLLLIQRYIFWRQGSVLTTGRFGQTVEQKFEETLQSKMLNIQRLVADSPDQKERFENVMRQSHKIFSLSREMELKYRGGDIVEAKRCWKVVTKQLEELDTALTSFSGADEQRLQHYKQSMTRYNNWMQYICYTAAVLMVIMAVFSITYLHRSATSKLAVILGNLDRLAADRSLLPALAGKDELDLIDQSFHNMYDALGILRRKERAVLENAAELICSLDQNLKFTDANAAAATVVGYTADDLLSRRAVDIVVEEEKESVRSRLQAVLAGEGGRSSFESTILRPDGETASLSWSVSVVPKEKTICAVIQDITQRKQLERIKRDFVAMVSHDIRAPLGNIQLVLSLLEQDGKDTLSKSSIRSLTIAKDNTQRLLALVNNLLDVEKIESGILTMLPEDCLVKSTVRLAIDALENLATEQKIEIVEYIDEKLKGHFDEEKVVQVLVNLISNSLKFSPPDTKIEVIAEEQPESIKIKVTDQGRGIPPEKLKTVFERFRQVEKDDHKQKKGAGLGLTICKAIVESHGGIIGVESAVNEGTTFWFTLPRFGRQ